MSRPARLLLLSDLMLLAVAAVWGSSYGVVKSALAFYPVLGLLTLRFGLTFVLLAPALRSLRGAGARTLGGVFGTGLLLLGIFVCETFGVLLTSAANAAFLISLCVMLTPWVEWLWLGRRPTGVEGAAVLLSLAGAWLLAGGGEMAFNAGDGLILLAALLRAVNVCATRRLMQRPGLSPLALTAAQSGVVAAGCAALAWTAAPPDWPPLPSLAGHDAFWASVLYLVLACTLFAFFAQNHAVRRSSPTRVALLMGSEPAFGALFACLWLGERISAASWAGGGLIVAASLLATVVRRIPRAVRSKSGSIESVYM
ncbi:DMT family transporter [Variovorax saccharolyticus]|uniref:DMT family transporter n=1 Tax=Variovorax saccharolyticus TaxID=3053516 RepID=UPI0025762FC2|nr:DMT family transporter [Variovorax sp. J22R187]MDM0018263.1 DMT family transporter [Variovorax sp. J22R187]